MKDSQNQNFWQEMIIQYLIATWPWIARHDWHDIGLKNFKSLSRWYLQIADREAVIRGYDFM